jgi:hypothetical protein
LDLTSFDAVVIVIVVVVVVVVVDDDVITGVAPASGVNYSMTD